MLNQPKEVADLIKYSRLAYERGLVSALGGNASFRIPGSNRVYVKSTNTSMGEVTEKSATGSDRKTSRGKLLSLSSRLSMN